MRFLAIAAVIGLLALGTGATLVNYRNQMVALDVAVDTQWKQVENQLARQHELLPKLAAIAAKYAEHEKEVLGALFRSRERYVSASAAERPKLAGDLDGALVHAMALAERYPELKTDEQFRALSYEIAGTKNRIAVERRRYNETVGLFNARLRQIPWRFAAWDLDAKDFYEPPPEQLAEPDLAL